LSLMAVKKTLADADVSSFVIFVSVMFVFFIFAWEIVNRENTLLFALVQGFRGLIVGDGDGLDFLGLKTDDETVINEEAHKFKTGFGTLGMLLFFTYLMNVLIGIFSSAYDEAQRYVWLHFHQARVQDLRDAILGLHKFRKNSMVLKFMQDHDLDYMMCRPYIFPIGSSIFAVAIVMQVCVHVIPQEFWNEFVYLAGTLLSILLLTLGSVLMESSVFMWESVDDDWFPAYRDDPKHKHSLFVFCRADFDESLFLGDDHREKRVQKIQDRLEELQGKFAKIVKKLQ